MIRVKRLIRYNPVKFISIAFLLLHSGILSAQNSSMLTERLWIKSMGQPKVWKTYLCPLIAWDYRNFDGKMIGEADMGVYRDIINPVIGLFGLNGEAYIKGNLHKADVGLRLLASSKVFYIHAGIDYSMRKDQMRFLVSLQFPVRRGGFLKRGECVRINWIPGSHHAIGFGMSMPINQPNMGKTRSRQDYIKLPKKLPEWDSVLYSPDAQFNKIFVNIQNTAHWINRFTIPFLDENIKVDESNIRDLKIKMDEMKYHIHQIDSLFPAGHSFQEEVRVYHHEMEKVFSLFIFQGESEMDSTILLQTVQKAREILFNEVILPYNRLLGQSKKRDSIKGYGSRAAEIFRVWLSVASNVPPRNHEGVMYVFNRLIQIIDDNRADSRRIWGDSRFIWIPCHYALRFSDHDTEAELDAIIEKAVNQPFTDANDVHYVINELFQPELERTVLEARDYHVLWIHDYRGLNSEKKPDAIAYRQTLEAYLKALTNRVRDYEETRKIPVYMIFLDQHFYELNKGKLWLTLLENPLKYNLHLPPENKEWDESIKKAQVELKTAVEQCKALQDNAKRWGTDWLTNTIKIHVNITNPSDLSFRSGSVFRDLGFVPDNVMRDHRKIAFYDVTEFDPGKGEAIITGMGVGEHYIGPSWEDRSVLARGPVLVSLKTAARELLISQGFENDEIPEPLREFPRPQNYEAMADNLRVNGWTATAMQVHNATGFGKKSANIIKALLYTLMPCKSHLYIPDSLWNNPFWGGMLAGAALRGCTVLVVSPSLQNAPSSGNPQMSRANELFTRFILIQNEMQDEIRSAGGLFKVGIYNLDLDVGDIIGRVRRINTGIAQSDLFRHIFPFDATVIKAVAEMPDTLEAMGLKPDYLTAGASPRKPKMHLKSQFFASEETINTVVPIPAWEQIVRKYIVIRAKQAAHEGAYADVKALRAELEKEAYAMMQTWRHSLAEPERDASLVYLTVGSQNEDYRSMVMDGETLFVIGHEWAMIAYLDFISLMGQTTWINTVEELETLLPRQSKLWQRLGSFLKLML